jgi:hypothetical protein
MDWIAVGSSTVVASVIGVDKCQSPISELGAFSLPIFKRVVEVRLAAT